MKKPSQKITAIIIFCVFVALMIAFVYVWLVRFNNSKEATRAEEEAERAIAEEETEENVEDEAEKQQKLNIESVSAVMYVALPELTMRGTPDPEGEALATLKSNDILLVTGKSENGWYRVNEGGIMGYCYGKYLSDKKQTPIITNDKKRDLPYYITVNRTQNIVTVYKKDDAGEYTVPYKAMVCSVGKDGATPLGTYEISDKFTWACLSGNVWGQYATRITGPYLFHSVPYFSESKSDLEFEEYNKLGEAASLGCVRMAVIDVKWVFEECPKGTVVTIYDSEEPEPLPRPEPIRIDTEDERKGWDPTDPDEKNPWKTEG
ncbi:MAG: L,D-transpeptidase family protein [Clostridia bacterium]|nr:L,D-transpeptidase family protein [Clostridia bacterium]